MNPKNQRLNSQQKDFIKLLAIIQPGLTHAQMQALYENKFGLPITERQLKALLKKIRKDNNENPLTEELTFELAKSVGLINLTSKVNRIMNLEDIANKSIHGDPHEFHTSRGTAITIHKKDFPTAINAIKAIKDEVGKDENTQSTYVIQIGDSVPPNHEDYQELPGDDDL